MKLQNYTEIALRQHLNQVLQKTDICQCEACVLDITAISLNKLKPCYIVTEQGFLFAQINELDAQFKIDIITAAAEAIEAVRNNPRHK